MIDPRITKGAFTLVVLRMGGYAISSIADRTAAVAAYRLSIMQPDTQAVALYLANQLVDCERFPEIVRGQKGAGAIRDEARAAFKET